MGIKKAKTSKTKKKIVHSEFDKYFYYLNSVQSPKSDVEFLQEVYNELKSKKPQTLREDFCGTFALLCEWVKLNPTHKGIGIDLDEEPTNYGKENYLVKLTESQQKRIEIYNENVLSPDLPKSDLISAMNFSYFIFKQRNTLKQYFANCLNSLKNDGVFIIDCFGGRACMEPIEEETEHDNFSYFWDQDSYDPVTNYAQFYIHFKRKGEKLKREKVFSYDWRMWSIPELRDILEDAGFKRTHVYWEGTDKKGEGDGVFKRVESVNEDCEAWVAYIVSEK